MRNNAYEAKIHEALLIKKQNPTINKEIYANGASFSMSVYQCFFCGRVDRASATEAVDTGSIPGRVKPKTIKIGIHSFPA